MLTMTETASTLVRTITDQSVGSAEGGLRISQSDSATDFAVDVVPAPESADQIIEREGARVFLEEQAATTLADRVLDAQLDENNAVRFSLGLPT
jgi:Fe-S cluster assembly iron-binding protein IscA